MTLTSTMIRINAIQHLIGQKAPKWDSPILQIIPAPVNEKFVKYMEVFGKTGDIRRALPLAKATNFDIVLVFRTPQLHGALIYEWYSYFYAENGSSKHRQLPTYALSI